ncbi:hypothetical protein GCM10027169_31320 [Gordonia jinhuaensis]|uniref:NADH:flavin oxidoreductase / NADH oxidase family protein n=1 Tax=Gordonia jinhuaensis TaxID=1517702 RepID=A0A916T7N2_9ACTN|nr:hypothetical protein [Gordonia jinhuaensis]GGB33554.1 hypothetical protein GCM10011489_22120 [Gordonia jinhuaensis]
MKLNSTDFQRGGLSIEDSFDVASALGGAGIDLLEISGGNYAMPAMEGVAHPAGTTSGYFLDYAVELGRRVETPLMLTGGLRTRADMEGALARGIDMVGIARPMASVPDYPARILAGEPEPTLPRDPRRTGYRPIDGYLQLAAHNDQLHRMAHGLAPKNSAGLSTAVPAIARTGRAALRQARTTAAEVV